MKYAVIRIKKAMPYMGSREMCDCYEIAYHGFKTLESAMEAKARRPFPEYYIVIQYWE